MTVEIKGIGKITASKEVLNHISRLTQEASDSYHKRKRYALAEEAQGISDYIYLSLKQTGYYNNL